MRSRFLIASFGLAIDDVSSLGVVFVRRRHEAALYCYCFVFFAMIERCLGVARLRHILIEMLKVVAPLRAKVKSGVKASSQRGGKEGRRTDYDRGKGIAKGTYLSNMGCCMPSRPHPFESAVCSGGMGGRAMKLQIGRIES